MQEFPAFLGFAEKIVGSNASLAIFVLILFFSQNYREWQHRKKQEKRFTKLETDHKNCQRDTEKLTMLVFRLLALCRTISGRRKYEELDVLEDEVKELVDSRR